MAEAMARAIPDVLIAGASARALAESAALAGYRVVSVDGYADLDLAMRVAAISLSRDFGIPYSAPRAARVAAGVVAPAVAYTSGFENHPTAIATLASGRTLLGNPPAVVRRVRHPGLLSRAFSRHGIATPAVRLRGASQPARAAGPRDWLAKPIRSGGGHGIRPWRRRTRVPRHVYLQEWIDGEPGSIVFAADGRHAVPLGISRQLVGDDAFGAAGFKYSGSLLCGTAPLFAREAELIPAASRLAAVVTTEFGLVGLNGIDFIARDGAPWPIEVNPRYTASMELIERARGVSMFALHAGACRGELPRAEPFRRRLPSVWGKAIVYARSDVTMREIRRWWRDDRVRDVPRPGERIARGRPICTLLASATEPADCHAALAVHAAEVYLAATIGDRSAA